MLPFDEKECYIRNLKNGLYLDVDNSNTIPGTNVKLWTSNQSNAQKWIVKKISNGKYIVRTKLSTTRALCVQGSYNYDNATIEAATTSNYASEINDCLEWELEFNGDGTVCFKSHSGHYLDAYGGGMTAGTNVIQYSYNGNPSMRWILETTRSAVNVTSHSSVDSSGHIDWTGTTMYSSLLNDAINKWNSYIGYDLFRVKNNSTTADLIVSDIYDPDTLYFGAYQHHSIGTDTIKFNTYYIGSIGLIESNCYTLDLRREAVASHELGHSLGLAHKETLSDIMTTNEISCTFPSLNDMRSYAEASLNY
jgi:hypothetical protein